MNNIKLSDLIPLQIFETLKKLHEEDLTELSDSAKYYRDNPDARKKKQDYDRKLNSDPKQVKKRVESNQARRDATKAGKNIKGKDASHTSNGIRFKESSKNRGSSTDTPGDKRARGKKKK